MSEQEDNDEPRPVAQESRRGEHIEIELPATNTQVVMDYGVAHALAEDILRITSEKSEVLADD